ncbi:Crp/Fnr family transcriptional regulator [Candidatus Thiothrix sp. Deng01]|uniref:Crp/Fnr family transcriptional regulator n=1 Tax=Candidatus Thiothrix phosphatis TaxID=3112415 RepID=A0ABU6D052_9GAMM|nr:Crp/Fnr family transcriptional regulator [Candidatus Thiothrix sp. Deng01]MEB4592468.1 Crp/Fnr family transcriptional regulator [Candidatus Thiothrix sp. Deng01]
MIKPLHTKLLAQVPLLAGLPDDLMESLTKACRFEQVSKGDYIFERNDTSRRLYFLLSGQVRMLDMNRQGQEVALAIIDAPIHFGELAVIDGYPRSAAVQATARSEIASISPKDAEALIYNVPLVSRRIMQNMAAIIRKNNWHRLVLQQQNIANRLAAYLTAQIPPEARPDQIICIRNMPAQYDLGILLGTTRESISRALGMLSDEGLIKREGKSLYLTNVEGLRRMLDEE